MLSKHAVQVYRVYKERPSVKKCDCKHAYKTQLDNGRGG